MFYVASHCSDAEAGVLGDPSPDIDHRPRRKREASGLRYVGKRLCIGLV